MIFDTMEEYRRWGEQEGRMRKADLAGVNTEHDLVLAQLAAKARRKAVGLTAAQAARAIREARAQKGHRQPPRP